MERYSLKSLKVVYIGMWLSFLGAIGSGGVSAVMTKIMQQDMTDNPIPNLICTGVSLLGWFLIIGGLSSARKYSERFGKARNRNIWGIVFTILASVLIAAIIVSFASSEVTKLSGTLGVAAVIGAIVLLILAGLFQLLYVKNLMGGCAYLAKENGDKSYARKCTVTWVLYLLATLAFIGSAVMLLYVFGKALLDATEQSGGQIDSLEDLKVINDDIMIVGAVFIASIVFGLIVYFMQMARVNGTYRRYHGEIIPGQEEPAYEGGQVLDAPAYTEAPAPVQAYVEPAVPVAPSSPSFFDAVPDEPAKQSGPELDFGGEVYDNGADGQTGPKLDFGDKQTDTITLTDIKE